jgi:nodulation protein A
MERLMWRLEWENDLTDEGHGALAGLLVRAYPRHADLFVDGRSWSGARPEVRVIGSAGDRPVAHLGVLRRFVRNPDTGAGVLVGDVGLVAVDPDLQGKGVGGRLLGQAASAMRDLELPFGFLTCGQRIVPFYESAGWQLLPGQVTRMFNREDKPEVYDGPAMLLPLHATVSAWPGKSTVDRNGPDV